MTGISLSFLSTISILFCQVISLTFHRNKFQRQQFFSDTILGSNSVIVFDGKKKSNFKFFMSSRYGDESRFGNKGEKSRAYAVELGTCDRPVEAPVLIDGVSKKQSYCYFDKRAPCPCTERCPIDDRFCGANRDYFDHVYGPPNSDPANKESEKENSDEAKEADNESGADHPPSPSFSIITNSPRRRTSSSSSVQRLSKAFAKPKLSLVGAGMTSSSRSGSNRIFRFSTSEQGSSDRQKNKQQQREQQRQAELLSRRQRRERRKKLFVMSTWIEDLLPDPHQGSSW